MRAAWPQRIWGDEAVAVIVKAGQTVTWGIYVSKFYDMSKPGKYAIQIERGDLGDPTLTVKSNTVTVTVTVP
jgi:hypothetical protein